MNERRIQGRISCLFTSIVSLFPTEIYSVLKIYKAGQALLTLFSVKYCLSHLSDGLLTNRLLSNFLSAEVND